MDAGHVLKDSEIVIGKATDDADPDAQTIDKIANGAFKRKCPLWTYILAEAALHKTAVKIPVTGDTTISTPRLGPVGGRIVAEVFLGLMFGDKHSMLSVAHRPRRLCVQTRGTAARSQTRPTAAHSTR